MAYNPTIWFNSTPPAINEDNLNKIESGIEDAHEGMDAIIAALHEQDIYPNEIVFHTTGAMFAPVIILDPVVGDVLWTFADGTTSTSTTPSKDFGTSGNRIQRLKVTPWDNVYRINVGYDAADGGAGDIELIPQQNVDAIDNLSLVSDYLVDFCANHNPLTSLNFDNFTNLDTIELYNSSLVSISIRNTPLLQRLQVENTSLAVLDLTETLNLGDIRASSNPYTSVDWGTNTFNNLWHICHRDTVGSYRIIFPTPANMPIIRDLFIWNTNQIGAGDYAGLTALHTCRLQTNAFTSLDLTNSFDSGSSLHAYNNDLTSIVLAGCSGLDDIDLHGNNFGQTAIDYIFVTIDSLGRSNGTIDTTGVNNAYPSPTGVTAIASLEAKGWTCSYTAVPAPTPPTLNTATIAANGNDWSFNFSENVVFGVGGNAGFAVTMSTGGAVTLTYVSGSGTDTLVYSGSVTINSGETVTSGLDYTQPGNGIEDTEGHDLVTFTSHAVVNGSTVGGGGGIVLVDSCSADCNSNPCTTGSMNFIVGNVVIVCGQDWGDPVGTISDTLGNTYVSIGALITNNIRNEWFSSIITNGGAGTINNATTGFSSIGALQFSGVDTADILGATIVGASSADSVQISTTTAGECIIFGCHKEGGPATGYTPIPVAATIAVESTGTTQPGRPVGYWIPSSLQTNVAVGCTPVVGTSYSISAISINAV